MKDLQYKMFLLNDVGLCLFSRFKRFTIQNVSIKFLILKATVIIIHYLQYKMFLLNDLDEEYLSFKTAIYNTKCFY